MPKDKPDKSETWLFILLMGAVCSVAISIYTISEYDDVATWFHENTSLSYRTVSGWSCTVLLLFTIPANFIIIKTASKDTRTIDWAALGAIAALMVNYIAISRIIFYGNNSGAILMPVIIFVMLVAIVSKLVQHGRRPALNFLIIPYALILVVIPIILALPVVMVSKLISHGISNVFVLNPPVATAILPIPFLINSLFEPGAPDKKKLKKLWLIYVLFLITLTAVVPGTINQYAISEEVNDHRWVLFPFAFIYVIWAWVSMELIRPRTWNVATRKRPQKWAWWAFWMIFSMTVLGTITALFAKTENQWLIIGIHAWMGIIIGIGIPLIMFLYESKVLPLILKKN